MRLKRIAPKRIGAEDITMNYKNLNYEIETPHCDTHPSVPRYPMNYKNLNYEIETLIEIAKRNLRCYL